MSVAAKKGTTWTDHFDEVLRDCRDCIPALQDGVKPSLSFRSLDEPGHRLAGRNVGSNYGSKWYPFSPPQWSTFQPPLRPSRTHGPLPDVIVLDKRVPEPGSSMVMDRGYSDFRRLDRLHNR